MPHQCTNCERVFADGSKEMLSGCPDCGGNKFQFKPDSSTPTPTLGDDGATTSDSSDGASSASTSADAPEPATGSPESESTSDAERTPWPDTAKPSSTDSDTPKPSSTGADTPKSAPTDADPEPTPTANASADATDADLIEAESDPSVLDQSEDTAQADARRDVVTRDELDDAASSPPPSAADAARTIPPDSDPDDAPGIEDLRAELNDQFESIKILEPGQYELNLMELYDRQECIISLQEDGHYVIEVADSWRDDDA